MTREPTFHGAPALRSPATSSRSPSAPLRTRTPLLVLLLLGCSSSTGNDEGDGGERPDVRDSGAIDGGAADAAPVDAGSREAICAGCVERRCSAAAFECHGDEECAAITACLTSCTTSEECEACTASASSMTTQAARELSECQFSLCWLSCASTSWPPEGGAECQDPGFHCEADVPGFESCCRGSCSEETGRCCVAAGEPCSRSVECCGGHADMACIEGRCEPRSCFEWDELCTGDRPCCDSGYECTEVAGGGSCCATDGTEVPEHSRCCSGSSWEDEEGRTFCGSPS